MIDIKGPLSWFGARALLNMYGNWYGLSISFAYPSGDEAEGGIFILLVQMICTYLRGT